MDQPQSPVPLPVTPAPAPLHVLGSTPEELRAAMVALQQPAYRADQVLQWIYQRHCVSFDGMSNLSKPLRSTLAQQMTIVTGVDAARTAAADGTQKLLIRWPDGGAAETVWIPSVDRHTACLSSQVGCPVGCRFCASGLDGVERNLSAGEIVEQALAVQRLIRETLGPPADAEQHAPRLSNIVMMGMGEPLANYREVVKAIRILNASWGMGIGARKITVSTVGLPKQIRMLAEEKLQVNLALSLHATTDALREKLIPWGSRVRIAELLDACWHYFTVTGREITLEYVLLAGVNDAPADADQLARIARRLRANINLLRYNPVPDLPFERPSSEAAYAFQRRVREGGANAHLRTSRGKDVQAACGQLRREARPADCAESRPSGE